MKANFRRLTSFCCHILNLRSELDPNSNLSLPPHTAILRSAQPSATPFYTFAFLLQPPYPLRLLGLGMRGGREVVSKGPRLGFCCSGSLGVSGRPALLKAVDAWAKPRPLSSGRLRKV